MQVADARVLRLCHVSVRDLPARALATVGACCRARGWHSLLTGCLLSTNGWEDLQALACVVDAFLKYSIGGDQGCATAPVLDALAIRITAHCERGVDAFTLSFIRRLFVHWTTLGLAPTSMCGAVCSDTTSPYASVRCPLCDAAFVCRATQVKHAMVHAEEAAAHASRAHASHGHQGAPGWVLHEDGSRTPCWHRGALFRRAADARLQEAEDAVIHIVHVPLHASWSCTVCGDAVLQYSEWWRFGSLHTLDTDPRDVTLAQGAVWRDGALVHSECVKTV